MDTTNLNLNLNLNSLNNFLLNQQQQQQQQQQAQLPANGCLAPGINLENFRNFKQLLDSQSLVDCTLACDGGKVSAHKIVLSACSSYLAKILSEHPVEHPIIILPELNIQDVKTLIHYMYTGELLKMETSPSLLNTAAILMVNSLNDFLSLSTTTNTKNSNNNLANNLLISPASSPDASPPNQNHRSQPQQAPLSNYFHLSNLGNNSSHLGINTSGSNKNNNNLPLRSADNNIFNQLLQNSQAQQQANQLNLNLNPNPIKSLGAGNNITISSCNTTHSTSSSSSVASSNSLSSSSKSSEFQFKCPVCHNDFQTICSFEYHMQRSHNVTSFGCEICHKPFASLRYVLTDHMRRCHGWKSTAQSNQNGAGEQQAQQKLVS